MSFKLDDHVRINQGVFEDYEGEIQTIDRVTGRVIVLVDVSGLKTPVEVEPWELEAV